MLNDLRLGVRTLLKSPGFTGTAIMVLALGIGGVAAVFSTLHAVAFRPLPYSDPSRLVLGRCTYDGGLNPWVAGPDYADHRDQSRSFSSLEAYLPFEIDVTVTSESGPERVRGLIGTVGLLPTLGATMSRGRHFAPDEGQDGGPPVVIVSHSFWQRHAAGEARGLGRPLTIDGTAYEIVGVLPQEFHFTQRADVWLPLRPGGLGPRRYSNFLLIGRLRDGVSLTEAQSDVDVIAAHLAQTYPDTNARRGLLLTPLQGALGERHAASLGRLGGGAAAILFIAWANVAGLLLARGSRRRGELAVRAQVGASRWRLMRLLLAEATVLSAVGGAIGAVLAIWVQKALLRLLPLETLLLPDIRLSLPVLAFILGATLLTTLGCGLLPAWRGRQMALAQDLRAGGRGASHQGIRLRRGLIVGQVAVAFVLLVTAGLLIRSLASLQTENPGFDPANLLTVEVPLPDGKYAESQRVAFFASLLDEVRALPGVTSAGVVSQLPLRDPYNNVSIDPANAMPADPSAGGDGNQRVVQPGYFGAMGIPLLAGRDVHSADTAASTRVVVLSQRLARSLFPDQNPLGREVVIDRQADTRWQVVGVVGDVKQSDLREGSSTRGSFYRPHTQQALASMRLAVRTAGKPESVVSSLRAIVQRLDREVPLAGPRSMEAVMANTTLSEEAQSACLTAASFLAVGLAAVGIYALLTFVVAQRQRDIGVRMALGASRREIAAPVVGEALTLVAVGLAVGGLGAAAATRFLSASLYGVTASDPATIAAAILALLLSSALAAWLPARRAARVDPIESLRCE